MGRSRDEDWAEAKRQCRLSVEEIQMARELGMNPRKLSSHIPSPSQPWKLPVGQWVRKLHAQSHGAPAPAARRPPRPPEVRAPEPVAPSFEDELENFDEEEFAFDRDPTEREIEEEDRIRLRSRESFRIAADYVAAAFARLAFVQKVVLFGSVARPLVRDKPRQWRYRRAGLRLWHEVKDVDLAVWVRELSALKAVQKARGRALNDLFADHDRGVAHHQVDVFLFEPGTDRYLGRLCHFGVCPKHKPECQVEGCGKQLFLRQHEDFVFDPRSLERDTVVLFDRAAGRAPLTLEAPAADDDDIPF